MDTHDISRDRGELEDVLKGLQQPALVIGIETDGLFTVTEQQELAAHMPNSELVVINSPEGHDGFLLEFDQMNRYIREFFRKHAPPGFYRERKVIEETGPLVAAKPSLFGGPESSDILMW
ncbi:Alpha/Beta hydrolase protein [Cladochytrium replicatum]|nr:Alpha/Beta hydrolase protein [Cladochytrium replicatum]